MNLRHEPRKGILLMKCIKNKTRKYFENFETWLWQRIETIDRREKIINDDVIRRINGKMKLVETIRRRKAIRLVLS